MEFEKIYASTISRKPSLLEDTKLIFPFCSSHSFAKKNMIQEISKQNCWYTEINKQPVFFSAQWVNKDIKITNILCSEPEQLTWSAILQMIERFARSHFVSTVTLSFFAQETLLDWLTFRGYKQDQNGLTKKLHYHTALVLSGGGARGAYQIGAWRALKELEISFDLIASTSVGALNAGLIMMDDETKAQQLWYKISTEQILAFPQAALNNRSFKQLARQLRSLGLSAIREKGVSTLPLQKLLRQTLDEGKLTASPIKLYICTTRLRGLKENVIAIDSTKQPGKWLAASAAFFPAMQPVRIKGEDYIDGGYRNDFPLDVALLHGAKECICIDAKGPGIRKNTNAAEDVAHLTLCSPWPLGSLLIFDSERSKINEQLGYLETMKYFHRYTGFWYTFSNTTNWQSDWQAFIMNLPAQTYACLEEKNFWQKFYKLYGKKVPLEQVGEAFVELIGRLFSLSPDRIYTKAQFLAALTASKKESSLPFEAGLSFTEWIEIYHKDYFLLSKKNQFLFLNELLEKDTYLPQWFVEKSAVLFVAVQFFHFLKKKMGKNA